MLSSQHTPSIAARVLDVIERSPEWLTTSAIYTQIEEAENITIVSVTCRDLVAAGKVRRKMTGGRWIYQAVQPDLLAPAPIDTELEHTVAPRAAHAAAKKESAHRISGHAAVAINRNLKLKTLDRLAELFSDDIAAVLRAIRQDVTRVA